MILVSSTMKINRRLTGGETVAPNCYAICIYSYVYGDGNPDGNSASGGSEGEYPNSVEIVFGPGQVVEGTSLQPNHLDYLGLGYYYTLISAIEFINT
jgi:hypothetical protein